MLTNVRNFAFVFAAGLMTGLALDYVANRAPASQAARATVNGDAGAIPASRPAASATTNASASGPGSGAASEAVERDAAASIAAAGPAAANGSVPMATQLPPIPPAVLSNDLEARAAPLNSLLEASSLHCDIDVAHGANWSQGKATLHGISYQGGPFSLDSIDLDAETAMMSGGSGVIGSVTGELEMRTTAGDKGLTFSAFTRHGDLLIVTVYPALDSAGRYRTVMTTFGDRFDHETAQFFGACDISLARR